MTADDQAQDGVPPHVRRAIGPAMADLVGQVPLDRDAADQIATILDNPAVEDIRPQMVAAALMNCLDRRVAEAESEIASYRALSDQIAAQAKSNA